ncbi:hypothetical protein AGMMS49992_32380 [Clostridia bacterium]|nr:hypothetical protein AGMMS49992_32380 [Clostridia bacterium]
MKSDALTIRVEHDTLKRVMELFSELGLTASVAVNMFFKQMLYENGLPFMPTRQRLSEETTSRLNAPRDQLITHPDAETFLKELHAYVDSQED